MWYSVALRVQVYATRNIYSKCDRHCVEPDSVTNNNGVGICWVWIRWHFCLSLARTRCFFYELDHLFYAGYVSDQPPSWSAHSSVFCQFIMASRISINCHTCTLTVVCYTLSFCKKNGIHTCNLWYFSCPHVHIDMDTKPVDIDTNHSCL